MHVTGACHCGAITFNAEVDEAKVMLCHCTDCQVLSASASRVGAIVLRDDSAPRAFVERTVCAVIAGYDADAISSRTAVSRSRDGRTFFDHAATRYSRRTLLPTSAVTP